MDDDFEDRRRDAARELFGKFQKHWQEDQNVTRAKQEEITLLEISILDMIDDQIASRSLGATTVEYQVEDYLAEIQRNVRRTN